MANQDKIYEYIKQHNVLIENFKYKHIIELSNKILDASNTGKQYAALKFLQKYCTPLDISQTDTSSFKQGDPRKYSRVNNVKNKWIFRLNSVNIAVENPPSIEIEEENENSQVNMDNLQISLAQIDLSKFPEYYKRYKWEGKHKLFGYPADTYPNFDWICSLENRFIWLQENSKSQNTASLYLIKEMIEWGGSQNGVLQKFNDGSGNVNLFDIVQEIVVNIDNREKAIISSLKLPGLGLTYASKFLRFMKPERYGALDSRIRTALLKKNVLKKIYDGNEKSMVNGYIEFTSLLDYLASELKLQKITKPDCCLSSNGIWKASEIEMALFYWASEQ